METKTKLQTTESVARMEGIFGWVERMGNKVPHPIYLFIWFFVIALFASAALNWAGIQVLNPATKKLVPVVNLLTSKNIANIFVNATKEFVMFAPVGTVFVATVGLGLASGSGFLEATLKLVGLAKSKFWTTAFVVLIGINGNLVGDAAFVIFPPLCAILFKSTGRNPLAGLFTAFASVACGFGASLFVGAGDAFLAGMTEAAAKIIDPKYVSSPAMGYYFLLASTLFMTPVGTWVTLRFVEPKLDQMGVGTLGLESAKKIETSLSELERKGLRSAGMAVLAFVVVLVLMTLPGMPFAAPAGKSVIYGPLLKSIPPLILLMFFIPGYMYGKAVGTVKSFNDAIKMMGTEIKNISGFFLICFFAAQFIAVFRDSNIGMVTAIYGGNFLTGLGIKGPLLLTFFVLLVGFINIFMGSMSAKWALLSSVFVPMLMIAGIDPSATQMAYRIGDSITNNITPTLPYLAVILGYAQEYDPRARTGTVLAYMLPFSIAFTVAWTGLLLLWLYLGLPIGPGYYPFR